MIPEKYYQLFKKLFLSHAYSYTRTSPYKEIKSRGVNNLDGVNDNAISYKCFYRDNWRMSNMGYEHSLMTTGERIADGIAYKKYNTVLAENFDSPLDALRKCYKGTCY